LLRSTFEACSACLGEEMAGFLRLAVRLPCVCVCYYYPETVQASVLVFNAKKAF
jgi:hypothetical protein